MQLAKRFGWAAPAYHKKEGATTNPEVRKNYCRMTEGLKDVLGCGLEHLGSLSGKGEKVSQELKEDD